jgi:hypothetical protein
MFYTKVKVNQSHYIPGQAHRVPEGRDSQTSRHSAHEGCKVVSPTHRPPLPQELFLVFISVRAWVNPRVIVRPEGLWQQNIPATPSGIEPVTFRLVVHCLNACCTLRSKLLNAKFKHRQGRSFWNARNYFKKEQIVIWKYI